MQTYISGRLAKDSPQQLQLQSMPLAARYQLARGATGSSSSMHEWLQSAGCNSRRMRCADLGGTVGGRASGGALVQG